ncbi:MAG: cellulase family glycosylhydrolase [Calditrichia bacterium]
MKVWLIYIFVSIALLIGCSKEQSTEPIKDPLQFRTAQQVLPEMMRGINIGNTLEPPTEGAWNNGLLQEYYFDDYKSAGFTTVRVPVRWENHTQEEAPYTVDEAWMQRVEQVVDWGLARDLYIIINAHHDWWLVNNYADAAIRERFKSIWTQIADRFQDKSPKLLFEIINEPKGMTQEQINELNSDILGIIRENNSQRIVIYSGHEWAALQQLLSAAIPDDDYVMGYFHAYDPWAFAGEGNGLWGSPDEVNAIKSMFETASAWSTANNIPVMISEFGAVQACDYNSRMLFYSVYVEQALRNNIAFQAWDDGGNFGIYKRAERDWPEVKDILVNTYTDGPTSLQVSARANSTMLLTWQNRATSQTAIRVERRNETSDFSSIVELPSDAVEYSDTGLASDTYFYRVVYEAGNGVEKFSYPVKIVRLTATP